MRPCWAILGLSPGLWGPSWGRFGSPLDGLGASERRRREVAKNIEKPNENQRFWLLGAPLGGLLGRLRGLRELSWGVFGPSWQFLRLSMRVLERSRGVWGPCWSLLGAIFKLLWRLWGRLEALLGHHGALSGPRGAVLEPFWEPLRRSWSVGTPKKGDSQKHRKN